MCRLRRQSVQGRGGYRQRSSGPLSRQAGSPRMANRGLASEAGLRSAASIHSVSGTHPQITEVVGISEHLSRFKPYLDQTAYLQDTFYLSQISVQRV